MFAIAQIITLCISAFIEIPVILSMMSVMTASITEVRSPAPYKQNLAESLTQ
ncbi:hypothetical protein [Nostoc sp. UHCC 0870]|uniref:hypothetical protein n=1 Tax=Nostoc sp. UHCC 0870 TaxID=2914041 RepID=UPI001EDE6586|nr:hypothetical protein [Nostoc sp. UHCC 0870]UKO98338.1 hypothetical protein L6494_00900 [Nostoc sp. UHCC 0870]